VSITFTDGVTPLNAANMNALEQKANKGQNSGYLGLDASGNANLAAAGKIVWAGDTNLYRSAANRLKTDGGIDAGGSGQAGALFRATAIAATNSHPFAAFVSGEANERMRLSMDNAGNPGLWFGPGGASGSDTNLYRSAASALKTDGLFNAGGGIISYAGAAQQISLTYTGTNVPSIFFGNVNDTALYRSSANVIDNSVGPWGTFRAAAFSVQSDRKTKQEIQSAQDGLHEKLLKAGIYTYRRDDSEDRHLGLMADELPDEVVTVGNAGAFAEEGETMAFIDIYKLAAALVATVQHLNERLTALEAT